MPTKTKNTKTDTILTLDDIEQIEDVTEEPFYVDAWGGNVILRSITKRKMREIKKEARDENGEADQDLLEKSLFIHGMVNPQITDDEQYEMLLDKSAAAMESILGQIIKASKMGEKDVKKQEKTFRP